MADPEGYKSDSQVDKSSIQSRKSSIQSRKSSIQFNSIMFNREKKYKFLPGQKHKKILEAFGAGLSFLGDTNAQFRIEQSGGTALPRVVPDDHLSALPRCTPAGEPDQRRKLLCGLGVNGVSSFTKFIAELRSETLLIAATLVFQRVSPQTQ